MCDELAMKMNSSTFILPLADAAATDPNRVGPKAANLAALMRAGLPTPGGFCIAADAYHRQVQYLGLGEMIGAYPQADQPTQRRLAVEIRLKLYQSDLAPDVLADVLTAWWDADKPAAVRSSSLIEDRAEGNFAGQFESFLGVRDDAEFLTSLRACWAALWTTTARRSMAQHGLDPSGTAMAVLVQPLVDARASGGALSETADGQMLISATWGLGSAIAQGEVVPDRVVLTRHGFVRSNDAGRKHHREACLHGSWQRRRHGGAKGAGSAGERALPRSRPGHHARPADAQMRRRARHGGRDRMGARRCRLQALAGAAAACRAGAGARRNLAQASRAQRPSGRHRLGLRPCRGGQLRMRIKPRRARAIFWSPASPGRR